jgi:hypothetical protein
MNIRPLRASSMISSIGERPEKEIPILLVERAERIGVEARGARQARARNPAIGNGVADAFDKIGAHAPRFITAASHFNE